MNKNKKKKFKIIIALLAFVVVVIAISSIYKAVDTPNKEASLATEENKDNQDKTFETPIGTLVWPKEWGSSVTLDKNISGDSGTIDFYGSIANQKVKLFSLEFNNSENGYLLGSFNKNGKLITVNLNIQEITKQESWSDDDLQKVENQQYGVNDLIDQINHIEGFNSNNESEAEN